MKRKLTNYHPLHQYLVDHSSQRVTLSFADIERILGSLCHHRHLSIHTNFGRIPGRTHTLGRGSTLGGRRSR